MVFFLPSLVALATKTVAATLAETAIAVVVTKVTSDVYDSVVHSKNDD